MIDGIATLTIVASTMIIATPVVSATRPSQRRYFPFTAVIFASGAPTRPSELPESAPARPAFFTSEVNVLNVPAAAAVLTMFFVTSFGIRTVSIT